VPSDKRLILIAAVSALMVISACGNNPADNTDRLYSIAGRVLIGSEGLPDVTVHLSGTGKDTTATSASDGSYSFDGLVDGSYALVPVKDGYLFEPGTVTVKVNGSVTSVQDIAASKKPVPPGTPSNFSATAASSSRIDLSWIDSTDENGFKLEMKRENESYSEVGSVPANATMYSATGLSPDTDYSFRIRAYNGTLYFSIRQV